MSKAKPLISLIVPVHNEETNIEWFFNQLADSVRNLKDYTFDYWFIDDGSRDNSLIKIKLLADTNQAVHFISFSRNFGKEAATSAGLQAVTGDAAIMIDADGQHPPALIDDFLEKWRQGYDVVIGLRTANQKEGFIKRYGSKLFYRLLHTFTSTNAVSGETDFRLFDRKVIDAFIQMTERSRITRGLIDWLGFRRIHIPFAASERHSGKAAYDYSKLLKLALHGFVSQTTKPLQLAGILGAFVTLASSMLATFFLIEQFAFGDPLHLAVSGTAILALFTSFLVGLLLICQWLLALYVESIHNETQNRPLFVITEKA